MRGDDPLIVRDLRIAAYLVIVCWGIMAASHILAVVLLSLLLAYILLPLPKWLMHRYHMGKNAAIVWTVVFMAVTYLVIALALVGVGLRLHDRLPIYEQNFRIMYGKIASTLGSFGIESVRISFEKMSSSEEIVAYGRSMLPMIGLLSDRILIFLLSLLLLLEMV